MDMGIGARSSDRAGEKASTGEHVLRVVRECWPLGLAGTRVKRVTDTSLHRPRLDKSSTHPLYFSKLPPPPSLLPSLGRNSCTHTHTHIHNLYGFRMESALLYIIYNIPLFNMSCIFPHFFLNNNQNQQRHSVVLKTLFTHFEHRLVIRESHIRYEMM